MSNTSLTQIVYFYELKEELAQFHGTITSC